MPRLDNLGQFYEISLNASSAGNYECTGDDDDVFSDPISVQVKGLAKPT